MLNSTKRSLLFIGLLVCCLLIANYPLHSQCGPTPVLYNGFAVALPPNGKIPLDASIFDAGSLDGCASGGLTFSFSDDPNDQSWVFDCNNDPSTLVDIWVTDDNQRQNFATTYILLQNLPPDCPPLNPDCGPAAIAYNGLAVDISAGPVTLPAAAFDAGSLDLCDTGGLTLEVGFTGSNLFDTSITIDCDISFSVLVDLRVTDALGNQSTVETYLIATDVQGFCTGSSPIDSCGPAPVLMNGLAIALPAGGQVDLPDTSVFLGTIDGCNAGNIQTTITDSGSIPDFNEPTLSIDCDDLGAILIEGYIRDNAGNTTYGTTFAVVQDNLAPEITCINGLAIELQPPGLSALFATDFVASLVESCPDTRFSFSSDSDDIAKLVSCQDVGVISVTIWATDAVGNQSSCQSTVLIQDNMVDCSSDTCTATQYELSGIISPNYYRASDYIEASGVIDQFALFQASNRISLFPGFSAPAGTSFSAIIAPCTLPPPAVPPMKYGNPNEDLSVKIFPNPFQDRTRIQVSLPKAGSLRIYLTDQRGQIVDVPADFDLLPDLYWEGEITRPQLPAGIYFLYVENDEQRQVRKLVRME